MNSPLQSTIILLLEHIVTALGTDFKMYLPQLIPQMLKVFAQDTSPARTITCRVSCAILLFTIFICKTDKLVEFELFLCFNFLLKCVHLEMLFPCMWVEALDSFA